MVELATILVGVIVPLFIGPVSVFFKSLWDRYNKSKELKRKTRYDTKMLELSDKINSFYWPVYLKLKTLDRLNYKSCRYIPKNKNKMSLTINHSDETTLSDNSNDGKLALKKKKRHKICSVKKCQNINHTPSLSPKCHKCRYGGMLEFDMSDDEFVKEKISNNELVTDESLEWDYNGIDNTRNYSVREISLHNDSDLEESNNLVVQVDKVFLENLDLKILSLCLEIKTLIEKNISIIQPSKKLIREIVKFTRYTEMLQIITDSEKQTLQKMNYDLGKLGVVNNTFNFYCLIKSNLEEYMLEYKTNFDNYNNLDIELPIPKCC